MFLIKMNIVTEPFVNISVLDQHNQVDQDEHVNVRREMYKVITPTIGMSTCASITCHSIIAINLHEKTAPYSKLSILYNPLLNICKPIPTLP